MDDTLARLLGIAGWAWEWLPLEAANSAKRFGDRIRAAGAQVIDVQVERDLVAKTETLTYWISLPARIPPETLLQMAKEPPGASRISIR